MHLARLRVGPEQQVLGVVEVQTRGPRGVSNELLVLALVVHAVHGSVVREEQLQRARAVARRAVRLSRQRVPRVAGAHVRTVRVGAQLVAEAPLLALVTICKKRVSALTRC